MVAFGGQQRVFVGGGGVRRLGERIGDRCAAGTREVEEPRPVALAALMVRDHLEHPVAGALDGLGEREKLVGRGGGAGYESVARAVEDGAAGGDADRAGIERLLSDA